MDAFDYPERSRDQRARVVRLCATMDASGQEVLALEDFRTPAPPRCTRCDVVAQTDGLCPAHWREDALRRGGYCRHLADEGCASRAWRHGLCRAHAEARLGTRCPAMLEGSSCLMPVDADGVCADGHVVVFLERLAGAIRHS